MTAGQIPDDRPRNLQEEILLQDAKAGNGILILGGPAQPLRVAPRLVANYGGELEDWAKMASTQTTLVDGSIIGVHWYRNVRTGQNVEYKFKREYPKTAPKNQ